MTPYLNAIEAGIALVLLGIAAGVGYHFGGLSCRLADATAVVHQEARNEARAATDAKIINSEAKTYHDAIAANPPHDVPSVSLCHRAPAAAVPKATAARPVADAAAPSGSQDTGSPRVTVDVGPPLVKIGVDADMQTKLLQDYIKKVCLAEN